LRDHVCTRRLDNQVAVFADGSYCGRIEAAYDIRSGRSVVFSGVKGWLSQSIVAEYWVKR
jgi:hypothetical protein